MRGSPLLRGLAMLLVLLGLAVPIWRLTQGVAAPPARKPAAAVAATSTHLVLTSSAVPFRFSVSHLGRVIWEGNSQTAEVATDHEIQFPAEGIDLVLKVAWEQPQPAAARLAITLPSGDVQEQTCWGDGAVTKVLTYQ